MDTWIIVLIAVIGIVVRILSSAAKKKAKQQEAERNAGAEGRPTPAPPPRASSMSDIQRAFMEMSGLTEEPDKAPPASTYSGSAGKSVPMSSSEGRAVVSNNLGSYEGAYSGEGSASLSEGLGSYEGAYSTEGKAGKTEGVEFHASGTHSYTGKYADVDLTTLKVDLNEDLKPSYARATIDTHKKSPLKLFENKDDFTKAVIYSEILNRRAR